MEKKDTIAKMKILKEYMVDQLSKENAKEINVNVIALDSISKNELDKDKTLAIYLVTMQYTKNGQSFDIEQYYSEDLENGDIKFIAGNNKNDGIEKIFLSREYTEDAKLREFLENQLNEMSKESKLNLVQLEKIAKELRIDIEDVESMAEVDLDQEIEIEKDKEQGKNEEKENDEKEETEEEKLSKISGKQTVNINAKFDGKTPLRNELGLSGEYKNVMVVYSEKLKELPGKDDEQNNSPVAFVAVKNDGSIEKMDSLELDTSSGVIPTREAIKADANGIARQDTSTLSRYKINGKNTYLSVQRGAYGEMKVYHGQKTKEENRPVEFQLETNSIKPTTKEMREMQHPGKGDRHFDNIDNEFQEHVKHGEKELHNRKDYDGDKETATHVHEKNDLTEEQEQIAQIYVAEEIEDWAKEIMKDEDVQNVFTEAEVKEMIENYWEKDKGNAKDLYSVEESKKEYDIIKSNIEKDAENMRIK